MLAAYLSLTALSKGKRIIAAAGRISGEVMQTIRWILPVAALAAAGLAGGVGIANALTVTVSSSSAFSAATSGASTTGFNSVGSGGVGTGPLATFDFYSAAPDGTTFSINSIGFTAANSGSNVNSANFYNQFGTTDITNQYLVNTYPPTGDMTLTITLPTAVTAFALDFSALYADTTATFTLGNGFTTAVAANDYSPDTDTLSTQFLGFLSTTPFSTITLSVPEDASWVVEDVTIATASTVPEPSTWAMMLAGFVGLGYAGYRGSRKKRAAAVAG